MSWFSKLFSQRSTVKPSTPIVIEALPQQTLEAFARSGCCIPNQCFRNAALAVANHDLAERYVLCFVAQGDDREYGHAIVKIGASYYDPTLQPQGLPSLKYRLHSEYTKHELRDITLRGQTTGAASNGFAHVYPPALKSSGEIVFEPISGPDF